MATDVLTVEELARYLRVDPQTVYRRFRKGDIPGVRIGRAIRFPRAVVEAWLRAAAWGWGPAERTEFRAWAGRFARGRGLPPSAAVRAVRRRRRGA